MTPANPPVYKIVIVQISLTLALTLIAAGVDFSAALSALIGGLICVIGNTFFMWWFFRANRKKQPHEMLRTAYWGEMLKISLLAVLFSAVFLAGSYLNFAVVLGSFIILQLSAWLAPLVIKT